MSSKGRREEGGDAAIAWAPHRLFGARPDESVTLAEIVGTGNLLPRWVVVFSYVIDYNFLFQQWPALLSIKRVVIFAGKPAHYCFLSCQR